MHSLLVLVPAAFLLALPVPAQRIYVDAGASPGGSGATWSAAYDDLGTALSNASSGNQVWVAPGVYTGGFTIPAGVQLWGGFVGEETDPSQRVLSTVAGSGSILDGGGTQRVLDVGDGCVVDGFTVQNGRAASPGGGGILCDGTRPILRRLILTGNRITGGRGHTICIRAGADPVISQCLIVDNNGTRGHCIDIENAAGTLEHLTLFRNFDNGIHMQDGADPVISNCIIARASGRGVCDVAFGARNNPVMENNLFWMNGISPMHYRGGELTIAQVNALSYASGNLETDPLFISETIPDLHLPQNSPAVDAGTGSPYGEFDIEGELRHVDGDLDGQIATDIGAYEFHNVVLTAGGPAARGATFTLAAAGPTGMAFLVGASYYDPIGIAIPPLGSLHLGSAGLAISGLLPGPVQLPIQVPLGLPAGSSYAFQAAGLVGGNGNLSKPLHLLIH